MSAMTCEKLLTDGTYCTRRAVARIIPSIEELDARGWLACGRHADRAAGGMRGRGVFSRDDLDLRIRPLEEEATP